MKLGIRHGVLDTPIYQPGLPIDVVAREYGIDERSIVKLASNENPLGPSPMAVQAITQDLSELHRYPDGGAWALINKLSEKFDLNLDQFIVGNGSNEILELIAQVFLEPGKNAVMGEYPFVVYPLVTKHFGAAIKTVPMPELRHDLPAMLEAIDEQTRVVFLASPNNPTPYAVDPEQLDAFIDALPEHVVLCFDGAYVEYQKEAPDLLGWIRKGKNILVTRTFSKIFGLAGLRVGYAYGNQTLISLLARSRQPFSVNSLALTGALAALEDHTFVANSKRVNVLGQNQLSAGFSKLGLVVHAGEANFMLVECEQPGKICESLLTQGVIVRSMAPFGLEQMIRVSIGSEDENNRLLNVVSELIETH